MQKLTCTLEFKEGRPVAKEFISVERPVMEFGDDYHKDVSKHHSKIKVYEAILDSRREFEISKKLMLSKVTPENLHLHNLHRFTATIENNIVTKIELI